MIPDPPPPLVWPHAWRPTPPVIPAKCETCDGHGVVGRMTFEGGDYDTCPECAGAGTRTPETEPEHTPCCSSHGVPMTCERYRRTHFVETRPCCSADAQRLKDETEES